MIRSTLLVVGLFAHLSAAETLLVPQQYPTIQSAIDASQDFDIIEVSPGTYNEYTTGNGNIVILRSTDGPSSTFIFGDVRFLNGETQQSRIQGFTVNGSIICQNSDAMIIDCVSTGAKSNGIVLENSATQVRNCTISGNETGILAANFVGTPTIPLIIDCTIESNFQKGVYVYQCDPLLSNCSIMNNVEEGIFVPSGAPKLSASLVCGNDVEFDSIQIGGDWIDLGGNTIEQSCPSGEDTDGDGVPDDEDGCPEDPNKIAPGICGCGAEDLDTDQDGVADCNDGCPTDPNKTDPGACGCGLKDLDTDRDGTADCLDNCPEDPLKIEPGFCGCGTVDTNVNGDVDCDGDFDEDDALAAVKLFGLDNDECPADVDGDGTIGFSDVLIILNDWGACP